MNGRRIEFITEVKKITHKRRGKEYTIYYITIPKELRPLVTPYEKKYRVVLEERR